MPNSFTLKNKGQSYPQLLLCLLTLLAPQIFSQKYVSSVAQSEAILGFSPKLFTHDFSENYKKVYGQINTSLPLTFDSPLSDGIQSRLNNHPLFEEGGVSNQGALSTSINAGMPLYDGSITLNYVENFQNSYLIENPNSVLDIDSTIENGYVKLRANLSSSFLFQQSWKTISGGYSLHLDQNKYIGFQLHKHLFNFQLHGNMKGTWRGNLTRNENNVESQFPIKYEENQFYTILEAEFKGSSWSPEISLAWGRWSWKSLLSTQTKLIGHFNFEQASPYFTDPLTLEMNLPTDSLLSNASIESSISGETQEFNKSSQEIDVYWITPEVHSLGFAVIPQKLNLSLTWFKANFGIKVNDIDSISQFVNPTKWSFQPDLVIASDFNFLPFRGSLAWLIFDSKNSDRFFEKIEILGLSKWLDKGHVPYLTTGIVLGDFIQVSIDLQSLPTQALNIGVLYVY
tara:strand:+ start:1688 stop:3055 length:1368 start_codon:yes stop_codon:yes gene_type:complete